MTDYVKAMQGDPKVIYGVWCEVWGGITGNRTAWLKADGKIAEFDSIAEAAAEAARLQATANGDLYRTANFRYTAQRMVGR
jgi:hypothetical protein